MHFLTSKVFRIAIKAGLASAIALEVGEHFNNWLVTPELVISGLWCAMSALLLVIPSYLGGTYLAAMQRLFGTAIGTIVGCAAASLFGTNPLSLAAAVAITILLCAALKLKSSLNIASLTVLVVMVLWQLRPAVSPWIFGSYRLIDSIIGISIGMAIAHLLWPLKATQQLRLEANATIGLLEKLYNAIFAPSFSNTPGDDSRREIIAKLDMQLQQMRATASDAHIEFNDTSDVTLWITLLDELSDAIISLQEIDHQSIRPLLDTSLNAAIDHLTAATSAHLAALARPCTPAEAKKYSIQLSEAIDYLHAEMVRFRTTHRIRQVALELVERYFSLTYSLKRVAEKIIQVSALLICV